MGAAFDIISKIDHFKPIPPVAHQVMALASDPDAHAADLANLVESDPAITANLLRVCNSAYFGLKVQVDSIQHAVALLGMNRMVELVLAHLAAGHLNRSTKGYGLAAGQLWKQSVASAYLAKSMAIRNSGVDSQLIFTAALLRDIGKTVMAEFVEAAADKLRYLVSECGMGLSRAEQEVFSIDHPTLGGIIAERWNFSGKLTHLIQHHHHPLQGIHADIDTAVIYLADVVMTSNEPTDGLNHREHRYYPPVLTKTGYSGYDLYALSAEYRVYHQNAEFLLNPPSVSNAIH